LLAKLTILDNLKETGKIGLEELSLKTGLLREQIMQTIQGLSKTYLINIDGDIVKWLPADNPSTIRPWGWNINHVVSIGSTQIAIRGMGLWSILVAEHQYSGRGRHGKGWISDLGGLWISYRLPVKPWVANVIPIALSIILIKIFEQIFGLKAGIKWPNDIVVNDKKIAGMIIEGEYVSDTMIVNIGVGINVNNEPPIPGTTSLKKIVGKLVPRNPILASLTGWISRLDKILIDREQLESMYRDHLVTLNRRVYVETLTEVFEAKAVDIDESGDLIVEKNGIKKKLNPLTTLRIRHLD